MASAYTIQLVCQVKYVYNVFFSKAEEQTNDQNTDIESNLKTVTVLLT